MPIVNPKALIEARQKKGWTQLELSEATKPQINVSTISRLERGKSARVRENTLRELARVLGVTAAHLCPTEEAERDVVKLGIHAAARNALTLVALRYGVRREHIVELAPLLFFLAAEQCLQERKKRLAEVRDAADSLFDRQSRMRHIPPHWPVDSGALDAEEDSIEVRDLFGTKVLESAGQFIGDYSDDFDEAKDNPFVSHIRGALAALGATDEDVEAVKWTPGLWPHYHICAEQAGRIVGGDVDAVRAILFGSAALHEMPKAAPEERAAWARAEHDRKFGDLEAFLGDILGTEPKGDAATGEEAAP